MKQIAVMVITLAVVFAAVAVVSAETELTCKKCGGKITGTYFETNGEYYHPHHFTCGHCNDPIKGEYTVYHGRNYHTDCFNKNVALRCALCDHIIEGKHLVDFWGNPYHLEHEKKAKACEYCSRYISALTTKGGVKYSDGRIICKICRATAVTSEDEAAAVMREVARHLGRIGINVDPGAVELHLVGLDKMQEKSGKQSHRLAGFTDFEETKYMLGMSAERRTDVYLLYGMPRVEAVSTLAHELMHVWQFLAGRLNNDRALAEGSCNYAAYLVLQNYASKHTEYIVFNLKNDKDKIYGEGFRRVKHFAEKQGIPAWLELLKSKNRLPKGY